MSTETFFTIITICAVVVTGSVVVMVYIVYDSFQKIRVTLELLADTSRDVQNIKNGVKTIFLKAVSGYIDKLQGGEKYDG